MFDPPLQLWIDATIDVLFREDIPGELQMTRQKTVAVVTNCRLLGNYAERDEITVYGATLDLCVLSKAGESFDAEISLPPADFEELCDYHSVSWLPKEMIGRHVMVRPTESGESVEYVRPAYT